MKEELLKYLENYWTSGRDNDLIADFLNDFFQSYQPERLSEKTLYNNEEEIRLEEINFPCKEMR